MADHVFHGTVVADAASASNHLVTKSQLDTAASNAANRANHTGTQLMATISDAQTYVDGRVSTVLDLAGSPSTLNTLNELAAALGDDPNYAATITSQIGGLDTRIDTLEAASSGGAGSYAVSIGDGALSTYTVTHSLSSTDVIVEVVRLSDGQTVFPVVRRTSANACTVDFGATTPAASSYRVLVRKVG